MEPYAIGLVVGLIIGVIFVGVGLLVAFNNKGSVSSVPMTKKRIILRSSAPPGVVYDWLMGNRPPGYTIDDAYPPNGIVIFSSRPTFTTWGFLYPVYVSQDGAGTRMDIGIKSRFFQIGPLVTRAHQSLARTLADLTNSRVEPF